VEWGSKAKVECASFVENTAGKEGHDVFTQGGYDCSMFGAAPRTNHAACGTCPEPAGRRKLISHNDWAVRASYAVMSAQA
jgi:hypothetical protein